MFEEYQIERLAEFLSESDFVMKEYEGDQEFQLQSRRSDGLNELELLNTIIYDRYETESIRINPVSIGYNSEKIDFEFRISPFWSQEDIYEVEAEHYWDSEMFFPPRLRSIDSNGSKEISFRTIREPDEFSKEQLEESADERLYEMFFGFRDLFGIDFEIKADDKSDQKRGRDYRIHLKPEDKRYKGLIRADYEAAVQDPVIGFPFERQFVTVSRDLLDYQIAGKIEALMSYNKDGRIGNTGLDQITNCI